MAKETSPHNSNHAADKPAPALRRARFGWCMYDWANSAFATVVLAAVLPVYLAGLVPAEGARLSLFGLGRTVSATVLWGYAVTCSMVIVALTAPWLGAMADRRGTRRRWLLYFCLAGSMATALLVLAGPGRYLLAAGLFVIGNVSFAASNIFYNAFLPVLAEGADMDTLSARGFAYGYLGGGVALLLVFALISFPSFFGLPDAGLAARIGFLLTGIWWALFSLPTFRYLRDDLPRPRAHSLPAGWRGYLRAFGEIRRYPDLLRFLLAFLCYNDGIQTIIVVAAIFAREELGLSRTSILGCFLMIQFVAMPGALLFGRIAERLGARKAVLISLALFILVTLYAFRMQKDWEFWLLGLVVAVILGGSQSVSRSLYGALIPPGKSAEFFGFYAITGKFASIIGPFSFSLIADLTGSNRLGILSLTVFFIVGIALLATVDVERGRRVGRESAES
jgi:UMF1 family MFS transporter